MVSIDHANHGYKTNSEIHDIVVKTADNYLWEIVNLIEESEENIVLVSFGDHGT